MSIGAVASNSSGLSFDDGSVLLKDGELVRGLLKKDFLLVGSQKDMIIASSKNEIVVINKNAQELLRLNVSQRILSASIRDGILAAIGANNSLLLVSMSDKKVIFSHDENRVSTITTLVAPPLFHENMVVFGSLDGKLVFVDLGLKDVKKSIIVTTKKNFANVSSLFVFGSSIIASGGDDIVMVSAHYTDSIKKQTRFLFSYGKEIYLIANDGRLTVMDKNLSQKRSIKMPFARISGVNVNKNGIFLVENRGFLLHISKDLKKITAYELADNLEDYFFVSKDAFYYGKRVIFFDKFNK